MVQQPLKTRYRRVCDFMAPINLKEMRRVFRSRSCALFGIDLASGKFIEDRGAPRTQARPEKRACGAQRRLTFDLFAAANKHLEDQSEPVAEMVAVLHARLHPNCYFGSSGFGAEFWPKPA
jgi:hypothetical protein